MVHNTFLMPNWSKLKKTRFLFGDQTQRHKPPSDLHCLSLCQLRQDLRAMPKTFVPKDHVEMLRCLRPMICRYYPKVVAFANLMFNGSSSLTIQSSSLADSIWLECPRQTKLFQEDNMSARQGKYHFLCTLKSGVMGMGMVTRLDCKVPRSSPWVASRLFTSLEVTTLLARIHIFLNSQLWLISSKSNIANMHACSHAYIRTYIHTYIHACIHTSNHAYMHA
jgi:hypothetical protein